MQFIYNCIPATNHVSRVYSVAAALYLQFMLYLMLLHPWNTFCTFILVRSEMCVVPNMVFSVDPWFCSFLIYCPSIVWVILKWFQLPLLLLVSLLLSCSACAEVILWGLNILKSSWLLT
jgi:hypothetical protein